MPTEILLARAPVYRFSVNVEGEKFRVYGPGLSFEFELDTTGLDADQRSERLARAVLRVYGIDRAIVTVEEPDVPSDRWPRWYVECERAK